MASLWATASSFGCSNVQGHTIRKSENIRTCRRLSENEVKTSFANLLLIYIYVLYTVPYFLQLSRIKPSALFLPINYERLNSLRILSCSVLKFSYFMLSDSSDYDFCCCYFGMFMVYCLSLSVSPSVLGEAYMPNDNLETTA